jgi:radical SAM protein with 4Fe4S-binding SPASM domain
VATEPNLSAGCLARSFLPRTAVLELTYACNHRCLFCSCPWFARDGRFAVEAEKSLAWWKATTTRLADMGVGQMALTGGEPLLKEGVCELLEHVAGLRTLHIKTRAAQLYEEDGPVGVTLLTNGKLLDGHVLDLCARLGVAVGISLPGLATFPELTGGHDPNGVLKAFNETRARKITTHVGITVTRRNLPELHETLAEALLAGADSVLLNRFLPGGRGLDHVAALGLSPQGILESLHTAEQVLARANRRGHLGTEIPRCLVGGLDFPHLSLGFRCAAAKEFFAIDPSGYVRGCNHSPLRLGSFDEIERVAEHPEWRRFVLGDVRPEACHGCSVIGSCDAGCREAARIVNGTPDAVDPTVPDLVPLRRHRAVSLSSRSAQC